MQVKLPWNGDDKYPTSDWNFFPGYERLVSRLMILGSILIMLWVFWGVWCLVT